MGLGVDFFKIKLDEIDSQINDIVMAINSSYNAKRYFNNNGNINFTYTEEIRSCPNTFSVFDAEGKKYVEYCNKLNDLTRQKRATRVEMQKEIQYLKDQELLQQQQQTSQQENLTKATEAAVQQALEQVKQAQSKTEQQKQIAQQELAKAQAALALAKKGDLESSKVLLGKMEEKKYKKTFFWIGGGIALIGFGFVVYKIFK